MFIVPLYIFLFIYGIALLIFALYYLIILYHIIHSASFTFNTFFVTFFIFASAAVVVYGTVNLLAAVDWQQAAISISTDSFDSSFIE